MSARGRSLGSRLRIGAALLVVFLSLLTSMPAPAREVTSPSPCRPYNFAIPTFDLRRRADLHEETLDVD